MRRLRIVGVNGQEQLPQAGQEVVIGLDVSRSKWAYACRWSGQEQRRFSSPGEMKHLNKLVEEYLEKHHCRVKLAYEACGFGFQIAWQMEALGAEVVVVAPSTIEKAPGRGVKTDGLDAGDLARRHEKGLLKPIYVPDPEHHRLRQVSRTYEQVMGDRRRHQTRLRLMLQEHGYHSPQPGQGWPALERWMSSQRFPVGIGTCVEQLVASRIAADKSAQVLKKELQRIGKLPRYETVVAALAAQPGVGEFTAIRFVLEIGDMVGRFPTADSLSNYLGLTPSEYSSGEMVHRGHVRKCGPGAVRAWLVQCSWAAIRVRRDKELVECYERLSVRAGKKKAIIAVARRLALRLRARWLEAEAGKPIAA